MGTVADLMVKVGADIGSFKAGMMTVNQDVERSGAGFGKLGILALGAGVAAAGAVTGIAAFGIAAVEKTTAAGQAAYQMSEKFGLAQSQASAWLTVARHLGIDSDQLGAGFKFLSKNVENMNLSMAGHVPTARSLSEAHLKLDLVTEKYTQTLARFGPNATATQTALLALQHQQDSYNKVAAATTGHLGPAGAAFSRLGLSAFDASGHMKSSNELMLEAADRFAKMPDGIEKTGLAMKVFGKQGMEMLPVLNLGRKGLEDLMAAGKQTGEVMSGPQVEAAHKMFLAQQKLNSEMTGFTTQVGTALMPVASSFIGWLTGTAVPGLVAFSKPWIEKIGPAVGGFVGYIQTLKPDLLTVFGIFSKLAPFVLAVGAAWVLWNVGLAVTEGIQAAIIGVQFVAGLIAIISKVGLLTAAQWLWNLAMDANPIGLVVIGIAALVAGLVWAYNNVGWFRFLVNALAKDVMAFASQLWTDIKPAVDWFGGAFLVVAGAVGAFATQFWADIKPIFDWLGPKIEAAVGWLHGLAVSLGLAQSATTEGTGHIGVGSTKTRKAAGGPVFAGGDYYIGESGPELFHPNTAGTIVPAGGSGSGRGGDLIVHGPLVHAETNADPYRIAAEAGYVVRSLRRTAA